MLVMFDGYLCGVAILAFFREVTAGINVVSNVTIRKFWVAAADLWFCNGETLLKRSLLVIVHFIVRFLHFVTLKTILKLSKLQIRPFSLRILQPTDALFTIFLRRSQVIFAKNYFTHESKTHMY